MRRFTLFGTWKNRLLVAESIKLAQEIQGYVEPLTLPFELSICPTMIALQSVSSHLRGPLSTTAQNLIWDDTVTFTGETSAEALREVGCKYVIIGHSERRLYLGENNSIVAKKVATALRHGLIPLICVGEFFDDYKSGKSSEAVTTQMESVLPALCAVHQPSEFVIAYEPAWAISTSREKVRHCEPSDANERHRQIRGIIRAHWNKDFASGVSIVYGGKCFLWERRRLLWRKRY